MKIALLTSTISPQPNALALKVVDPTERLVQYRAALEFYLELLSQQHLDAIVYVDNSGHDLSELQALVESRGLQNRVEFVGYTSTIPANQHGRFYLELNLLEQAFSRSKVIEANPTAMIWKISGRYTIRNLVPILERCDREAFDACFNYRSLPAKWTDFFLAGFTAEAYRKIFSAHLEDFRGNQNGEAVLRALLDADDFGLTIRKRLPLTPFITGVRGYDGASYGKWTDLVKYQVRAVANRVAPSLWI